MGDRRLALSNKLRQLLGNDNVYYQPPESLKMVYPCIRYKKTSASNFYADNRLYLSRHMYEIMIISRDPLEPVVEKIPQEFKFCSPFRTYVSDNLYHTVYNIYW